MNKEKLEIELKEFHILLYKIAYSKLHNREDAEDVVSETYCIVMKNLEKVKDENKVKYWIFTILGNECSKVYKNHQRDLELFNKVKAQYDMYDYSIEDIESEANFEALIDDLKDDEKEIFRLYFNGNYTLEEVSKILNENDNTVRSKLRRGKEKLKDKLKEKSIDIMLVILISFCITSGITIAKTNMVNNRVINYKSVCDNNQIEKVECNIKGNSLNVEIDFVEEIINKENFDVDWDRDAIYLIDSNNYVSVLYPGKYEWLENDIFKITFDCEDMELGQDLSLHIISRKDDSITIMLKK